MKTHGEAWPGLGYGPGSTTNWLSDLGPAPLELIYTSLKYKLD